MLEAMNASCAIITTNTDGCAEVEGNAGVVIENKARECVMSFSWTNIADRYDRCFQAVLKMDKPLFFVYITVRAFVN